MICDEYGFVTDTGGILEQLVQDGDVIADLNVAGSVAPAERERLEPKAFSYGCAMKVQAGMSNWGEEETPGMPA